MLDIQSLINESLSAGFSQAGELTLLNLHAVYACNCLMRTKYEWPLEKSLLGGELSKSSVFDKYFAVGPHRE